MNSPAKKIGITADNYKVERFQKELDIRGFTYEVKALTEATSAIIINTTADKVKTISALCHNVENHFKRSN